MMVRLTWDERSYESGVDRGVFYPLYFAGEAWNGLVSVKETSNESSEQSQYLDGVKVRSKRGYGSFSATIEAFTYPDSFYDSVVRQSRASIFGLSYRVKTDTGYKIHLVYNALASPSPMNHQMDETDPFSWDITTRPIDVPDARMSAHLVIDASQAYSQTISDLEDALYGSDSSAPRLPLPYEVLDIFEVNSILRVTDNGDGTFTVDGPDSAIQMLDATTFQITWDSAVYIDQDTYTIRSL